ncbi:hypothetical protein ACWDFR_35840 [Streptomyces sp. 900105755]
MGFLLLNDEPVTGPEADLLGAGQAARRLAALLHDCRELGARITSGSSVLFEHIDAACAEIRQRRS